jgi:hypothetical protein
MIVMSASRDRERTPAVSLELSGDTHFAPVRALPSGAAVLVREDIYKDRRGSPVDFTRTVWPGDTTRLVLGG